MLSVFSPSNLHNCSLKCLEMDVVDLMFALDAFRARKCDIALERNRRMRLFLGTAERMWIY